MICHSCRAAGLRTPHRSLLSPMRLAAATTRITILSRPFALSSFATRRPRRLFTTTLPRPQSSPAVSPEAEEAPHMTAAESAIATLLNTKLQPTALLVQDISGGCGSMYAIDITSSAFRGLSILKQQRLVNAALGDLVKEWHGVQIRTKVPPEEASS